MIAAAFIKAIQQLGDPRVRKVVILGFLLAGGLLILLAGIASYFVSDVSIVDTTDWPAWLAWVDGALKTVVFLIGIGVYLVLFPAIMTLFIGVFLEDVADAVEDRHYPNDPSGRAVPVATTLSSSLRFLGVTVLLNLASLPLHVIFLFFPLLNLFLFYGLNGYLLSREYFELVTLRHLGSPAIRTLRRAHRGTLLATGVVIVFLMTVPLVNLLAPVVATAAMVHVYKRLAARQTI